MTYSRTRQPGAQSNESSVSKVRLLVVEDNVDHAQLVKDTLETNPEWTVDITGTIEKAFERLQTEVYQVVLIDFRLPDGNGLDLIEWARNESSVVVMTSQGDERVAVDALQRGAYEYVVKDSVFQDMLPDVILRSIDRYNADKKTKLMLEELKEENRQLAADNTRLADIERARSECLTHISRTLHDPLDDIRGCVERMGQTRINKKLKAYLASARTECDRLDRVINKMVDLPILESGALQFRRRRADIGAILDCSYRQLLPSIKARGQKLQHKFAKNLPQALCDKNHIMQALTLLINYTLNTPPYKDIIRIETRYDEIMLTVVISGNAPEGKEFQQVPPGFIQDAADDSLHQKKRNMEASLETARGIVRFHGGNLETISVPESGDEYSLSLPIYTAEGELQAFFDDRLRLSQAHGERLSLSVLRMDDKDTSDSLSHSLDWSLLENQIREAHPGIVRIQTDDVLSYIPEKSLLILTHGDEANGRRVLQRIVRFMMKRLCLEMPMQWAVVPIKDNTDIWQYLKLAQKNLTPVDRMVAEDAMDRQHENTLVSLD